MVKESPDSCGKSCVWSREREGENKLGQRLEAEEVEILSADSRRATNRFWGI